MPGALFGLTVPNRLPLINEFSVHELIRLVEIAEEIRAFDSAWLGDNLLTKPRLEAVSMLSAIATRTRRLRLGTACMSSFPLRDPIVLGAEWATLDILSSGRTILGVCIGGAIAGGDVTPDREFATFGRSIKDRVSLMIEGVEVLRRLWTGEMVSYSGRHYKIESIRLLPKPIQDPVPIWLAVSPRPDAAERAHRRVARLFDGWITTKLTPSFFADQWEAIRRYASEYGRRIDENLLYYNINVNPDREAAFRETKEFLDAYYMTDFSKAGIDIWTAYGSPGECIKKLDEYFKAGVRRITLRFTSWDQVGQLMRFERDVLPSF